MSKTTIRATLVELWNTVTKYNEDEKVYNSGYNNLYPNEIELVVQNSPSAFRGSGLMSTYITGNGLTYDPKFNGVLLSKTTKDVADDISVQYGSWVHVGYGIKADTNEANFEPNSFQALDYVKCRKSKEDDDENAGKVIYKDFSEKKGMFGGKTKEKWFYPYTNDQKVIRAQIKRDNKEQLKKNPNMTLEEMMENYRGQVYYLNLTPRYKYAISHFTPVYNDCDTEYRMGVYSNGLTREGFLGKIAVLTSGLDEETSKRIKSDVATWLGSENASTVYYLEIEDTEDLEKNFKIINVPSQYDEAQFKDTKEDVRVNILGACNNIPTALAFGKETSLFGNSGAEIYEMKKFYQEQTAWERKQINEMWQEFGIDTEIIELVETKKTTETTEE